MTRLVLFISLLLLLLVTITNVVADEDELISVALQPSCSPEGACAKCDDQALKECLETGFTQRFRCEENVNNASGQIMFRYESCIPKVEGWIELVRFDIVVFVGAMLSLIYVRSRKMLAASDLVTLVNRS